MVQKIDAVENFSEFPRKQLFKESFFVKLQPLASKRGVLKIFAGFTGKHLCWSPLNKVAGRPTGNASVFRLRALLKKRHCHMILLGIYKTFSRVAMFITHLFLVHPFPTPENIRETYGFPMFSGGRERLHLEQMG